MKIKFTTLDTHHSCKIKYLKYQDGFFHIEFDANNIDEYLENGVVDYLNIGTLDILKLEIEDR